MIKFYLSMECPNCNTEIVFGPHGTTLECEGLPVIPFDFASQMTIDCEKCGAVNYTGDLGEETLCEAPEDDEADRGDR